MSIVYSIINPPVWASDREVIRMVWKRLKPDARGRMCRCSRHDIYRSVLAAHRRHRELVREFRL